jgi:hypothetical protein
VQRGSSFMNSNTESESMIARDKQGKPVKDLHTDAAQVRIHAVHAGNGFCVQTIQRHRENMLGRR